MYNRESNGKIKLYLCIWTVLTKKNIWGLWKSNPDMFIISHLIIEIIIHQMVTLLFYWFYKVFSCQCHFLLFLKYKCTIHNDTVFLMIYQKLHVHWKCCLQKCMSLKLDKWFHYKNIVNELVQMGSSWPWTTPSKIWLKQII